MELIIGILFLVMFMGVVMGAPYVYFIKKDRAYAQTEGQTEEARLNAWYGR